MNYAGKREKAIKRKRIAYLVISIIAFIAIAILVGYSFISNASQWKYHVLLPNVEKRGENELRIHYIDVGQGDATLIELPDGKVMLIDGGDGSEEANYALLRYLNALEIETIDYLVATHADADHCGGLAEVLNYKRVERAFLPIVSSSTEDELDVDGAAYQTFFTALQRENCTQEFSRREITLSVLDGETPYTLAFLYPYTVDGEKPDDSNVSSNDSSCVIWLDYKGVSAIFTGDISDTIERRLVKESQLGFSRKDVNLSSTEILKVAHHGSNSSTCAEWLAYLSEGITGRQTAVISCGENNVYGHPSIEVSQRLLAAEVDVYRTDLDGTVMITVSAEGTYAVSTQQK